jgi:dihydrodipicolinate synthase/N-acetylneuraminate lyase
VSMVKYWGELMGMAGGSVRPPLAGLSQSEKDELARDLRILREQIPATVGDTR